MPLFDYIRCRSTSIASTIDRQQQSIPSFTINIADHDQSIPFPVEPTLPSPRPLSTLRRVSSFLSSSTRSRQLSTLTTRTRSKSTLKATLSISTTFSTFSPKSTTSSSEGLKRFISYPILQSSSSPISPQSSDHSHEEWGKREIQEKVEKERDSISIYGLEEILRLSLCPPHLFPDDGNTPEYSHLSTPSASNRESLTPSDESVSFSLFDDESISYNSPSKVNYPHQPLVQSSTLSSARSRSYLPTTRPTSRIESKEDGFSFCPTLSASNLTTPVSTPARSIFERDIILPSTPLLKSKKLESSPSSLLFLPPSDDSYLDVASSPPFNTPEKSSHPFARNSGHWLVSSSPTRSPQ